MQLYDKKTERMRAAEASIKLLLDNPSKEMAVLIKEAQEQYDSKSTTFLLEYTRLPLCSRSVLEFISPCNPYLFSSNPQTSRFQATQLVVSGCQRCRDHTFPSGFRFPPHLATPEADVRPFWPQAPCCATRGCNSTFTPWGKDLSFIFLCLYPPLFFYPYIAIISFSSFYLFSHPGHWS